MTTEDPLEEQWYYLQCQRYHQWVSVVDDGPCPSCSGHVINAYMVPPHRCNCPACGKPSTHAAVCDDCYRAGERTPPLSVDPGYLWREWTK